MDRLAARFSFEMYKKVRIKNVTEMVMNGQKPEMFKTLTDFFSVFVKITLIGYDVCRIVD